MPIAHTHLCKMCQDKAVAKGSKLRVRNPGTRRMRVMTRMEAREYCRVDITIKSALTCAGASQC